MYDPEYAKQYRANNKERLKQNHRKWYEKHKVEVIKRVTKTHKEKMEMNPSYVEKVHKYRAESERKSRRKPERKEKIEKRKQEISQLKDEIKLQHRCLNPACKWQGDISSYCLDFHHVDKKNKKFSIGMSGSRSIKSLLEEISKCTVLCAICHREHHWGNLDVSSLQRCDVSKLQCGNTK